MASVYRRKHSRFWWVKYRDPATGKTVRKSTGLDVVIPNARKTAKGLEADYTRKEMMAPKTREAERWESWADAYFRQRYANNPLTLVNSMKGLRDCLVFFREFGILVPRQVTYAVASRYVPWRIEGKTIGKVCHNTARLRFITLSVLMGEAVRRGFAEFNPCRDVKVPKKPAKEKEEITAEHQALIETALKDEKQWMRDQWLVMMRHGCRIAETRVPLGRINECGTPATITFRVKGGKLHTTMLHPDLLPMVQGARAESREFLVDPPIGQTALWCQFFQRLAMPYSAHCCRVTVITRLLRENHSPALVCSFIGHSEEVNRIYRRLKPADSLALLDTLAGVPSPSAGNGQPRNGGGSPATPAHDEALSGQDIETDSQPVASP